jgi:ferredoxin-NADP reductase
MAYTVKILETEMLNHNVKQFTTEKPQDLNYTPGQAVLMEIPEMKGRKARQLLASCDFCYAVLVLRETL